MLATVLGTVYLEECKFPIKVTLEVQKVCKRRSELNTYSKAPFCQTKSFRERNSTPLSSKKRTFVDFKLLRGKRDGEYID